MVIKYVLKYFILIFFFNPLNCKFRQVSGELFAYTGKDHPFNIIPNGTDNSIPKEQQYREASDIHTNSNDNIDDADEYEPPDSTVLQRLKQKILKYVFYDKKYF